MIRVPSPENACVRSFLIEDVYVRNPHVRTHRGHTELRLTELYNANVRKIEVRKNEVRRTGLYCKEVHTQPEARSSSLARAHTPALMLLTYRRDGGDACSCR